jgi:hypothetical protein
MRRFLPGLSLSIAFVAGCVAAQLSQLVIPPARANHPVPRWEYHCVKGLGGDERENTAVLSSIGAQGWELVTILPGGFSLMACFKRPYFPPPASLPGPANSTIPTPSPT